MIGGSTNNKTNSGASFTVGSPGNSARITPVSTSSIAGGTLSRSATSATAAITTSRRINICIVGIIGALDSSLRQELQAMRRTTLDWMPTVLDSDSGGRPVA